MIKGFYQKRIDRLAHEICLFDEDNKQYITLTFNAHKFEEGQEAKTTLVSLDGYADRVLVGLAEALMLGGFLPQSSTDAELRATKYHLEDMRKLALSWKEKSVI